MTEIYCSSKICADVSLLELHKLSVAVTATFFMLLDGSGKHAFEAGDEFFLPSWWETQRSSICKIPCCRLAGCRSVAKAV